MISFFLICKVPHKVTFCLCRPYVFFFLVLQGTVKFHFFRAYTLYFHFLLFVGYASIFSFPKVYPIYSVFLLCRVHPHFFISKTVPYLCIFTLHQGTPTIFHMKKCTLLFHFSSNIRHRHKKILPKPHPHKKPASCHAGGWFFYSF